jgi:hypothetical protein
MRLTISSVLLESPTEHGDLLTGDAVLSADALHDAQMGGLRVEEGLDDLSRESVFLVLVLISALLSGK